MIGALNPRAPPTAVVMVSQELRMLVYDVYPKLKDRSDILHCIETHLTFLLDQGRVRDAHEFLRETEIGLRQELISRSLEQRRSVMKIVGTGTLNASLGVAAKYIASKLGFS